MSDIAKRRICEFQAWIDDYGQIIKVDDHSALVQEIFGDSAFPWMEQNLGADEIPDPDSAEGSGWQWNEYAKRAQGWVRVNYQNDRYCSEFSVDFESSVSRTALRTAYRILRIQDGFQRYCVGNRTFSDRRQALRCMRVAVGSGH